MVSTHVLPEVLDSASKDVSDEPKALQKSSVFGTTPEILPQLEEYGSYDGSPDLVSPVIKQKTIIVANDLPLRATKDAGNGSWMFTFDEDSLLLHMKDGLNSDTEVYFVGSLKVDIEESEQERIAEILLDNFRCVPTFLPPDLRKRFYHGFCKHQLWHLFHYMLPICPGHGDRFDRSLWQAYVSANKIFAEKVTSVIDSNNDYVWVHDYHLMALPSFLRKNALRVKLGFFLHCPFPSSEIYSTLPVREEILTSLLNCDLIGFHTYDYARHFLSCCSRMMGLQYKLERGHIGIEYLGRTIGIKILPIGINVEHLQAVLRLPCASSKVQEIQKKFEGKKLILGVDDMDIFKGISLKLLAFELLLQQNPDLQGKLVLVQIANPPRSIGQDIQEAVKEASSIAMQINKKFGYPGYDPVVLIDNAVPAFEKVAYYVVAECCIVNAVRDGMNLVPYEYIVCRQGSPMVDSNAASNNSSMLVVSEFIGCSPSLSGAIRVNPWDGEAVAQAIVSAINLPDKEKQLRHEKHYQYVSSHTIAYWSNSFVQDLKRTSRNNDTRQWWRTGLGLGFRVIALPDNFTKLYNEHIVSDYTKANRRAIFLDYDGTVVSQDLLDETPKAEVINVLNALCSDPKNTVFIVSGRGRSSLSDWFSQCEKLGIAAEHGYFIRWEGLSHWETCQLAGDFNWKYIAQKVMKVYTETTDGSYLEPKESAIVWHYQYADPDFGSIQAKEMLNHLESVLANEPVEVKRGHHIVEVKPQGVGKGVAAEKLLSTMLNRDAPPDFVMCIGDDCSDEPMFESVASIASRFSLTAPAAVFTCTVGPKPSKAKFYLDDPSEVIALLNGLVFASGQQPIPSERHNLFHYGCGNLIC